MSLVPQIKSYLYSGIAVGDMQWFYASVTARGNEVRSDRLFDITEQRYQVNVAETTMDAGNADTAWSRYLPVRPTHMDVLVSREIGMSRVT
jgi:hypothetical protein